MSRMKIYIRLCIIFMLFSCFTVVAHAAADSQISLTPDVKGSNQISLSLKAVSDKETIASLQVMATTSKKVYKDMDKAVFTNAFLEEWVRHKLNKKSGDKITITDLDRITVIQFGGDLELSDEDNISPGLYYDEGMGLEINGQATIGYNFYSLTDFSQFRKLKKLTLVAQQITDISALANLTLEELDLRGNRIADITTVSYVIFEAT